MEPVNRQPDRRDVLSGRSPSFGETKEGSESGTMDGRSLPQPPSYLQHFTHRAMGTDFEVLVNFGQYPHAAAAILEAFSRLDDWENRLSIFRPQSEISRINLVGAETDVRVSPELLDLLQLGGELNRDTRGAFDLTCTPLCRAWGFLDRRPALPSASALETALQKVDPHGILIHRDTQTVRLRRTGLELNLHGLGKGFAVEQLSQLLRTAGLVDFVVHGGQSSLQTSGNSTPVESTESGWRVGITHPLLPHQRLAELRLVNESMSTSGSARQSLVVNGRRVGHILDPRTGWPAAGWVSVNVLHRSATMSDGLATAFFVMSETEVREYCQAHPEVQAILFREIQRRPGLEAILVNMELERLEMCAEFQHVPVIGLSSTAAATTTLVAPPHAGPDGFATRYPAGASENSSASRGENPQ